jgi:hypothetical protein
MPKSHASIIPKNIFGKSPRLRHHTPISANLIQTTTMDVAALYERFASGVETYSSLKSFFDYHYYDRRHQGLGNQTPWEVYSPLGRKRPVAGETNSRKPQDAAACASGGAIGDNSSTLEASSVPNSPQRREVRQV